MGDIGLPPAGQMNQLGRADQGGTSSGHGPTAWYQVRLKTKGGGGGGGVGDMNVVIA